MREVVRSVAVTALVGIAGECLREPYVDVLTPAERRDLTNALLRAAWSATLARPASS